MIFVNSYRFGGGIFCNQSFYHGGGAGAAADRYDVPNNASLTPAAGLTYSFWFKTPYTGSTTKVFLYKLNEFEIAIRFSQKIACRLFTDASNRIGAQTSAGVTNNVWQHIGIVYTPSAADYTDIVIYFDGVAQTMSDYASAGTFTGLVNTANSLVVGGDVEIYENFFIMFDKSMSSTEIGEIYNGGVPRDERLHFPSDIISYYTACDSGDGAGDITDIGGNNTNDGTFVNMTVASNVVNDFPQ